MQNIKETYDNFYKGNNDYSRKYKQDTVFFRSLFKKLGINDNQSILEIGCGSGYYLKIFKDLGLQHITGTDFSDQAVNWAQRNTEGMQIQIKHMDTFNLTFPVNTFDIVIAIGHSPLNTDKYEDIVNLLKKISLIIKPGGYFIFIYSTNYSKKWHQGQVEVIYNHSRERMLESFNCSNVFSGIEAFSYIRPLTQLTQWCLFSSFYTKFVEILTKSLPASLVNGKLVVIGKKTS